MQLIYEGTDITDDVLVDGAQVFDSAGGRSDELIVTCLNPADWLRWSPKEGDTLEVVDSAYHSGKMYLDACQPNADAIILSACSMPKKAREPRNQSYTMVTLYELMSMCAAELGMPFSLYGLDPSARYRYLERRDEGVSRFLSRILDYEGAVLKFCDGAMLGIGIEWAQSQAPVRDLMVNEEMNGIQLISEEGRGYASYTIRTPHGEGTAQDDDFPSGNARMRADLPVYGNAQAARWAKGSLLMANRQAEKLIWETDYDPYMTALVALQVSGIAEFAGKWLVEGVAHDLINQKTGFVALRCRENISIRG